MQADDLNLFFALVGASTTAFLGLIIFFHDRKSVTNIIFIVHAAIGALWAVATYFSLANNPANALFWIRGVIFLAVPHVFLFFLFVKNFPSTKLDMRRRTFFLITALMLLMMFAVTTPYVFSGITIANNQVSPVPGVLMPIFAPILVIFFLLTVGLVLRKYILSEGLVRRQWIVIGLGLIAAYTLLIFFVFVRVIVFDDTQFVPYSPLFILPIFAGAAYAILRHHLFSIKVIATEVITFLLLTASLIQVLIAETNLVRFLAAGTVLFVLYFGILLVRSVLKEVEQREQLQKLTEELKVANTKLEELSKFKTQLLSLASHQIKAPLAAIKGFVSILSEGLYGPISDKIKETLGKIKFSADELIDLINNLLDMRKVEEGRMEYKFEKTELKQMINTVMTELQPLANHGKALEFTATLPPNDVFVSADAPKLKQVIQNLTDNALKYTPEGFVRVELKEDGGMVEFSVTDSGLGVSPEVLPHLFEEFNRDDRIKQKIRGTGLGLFIAKKIIEAHGGTIAATSEGDGKGSRFSIRLKRI